MKSYLPSYTVVLPETSKAEKTVAGMHVFLILFSFEILQKRKGVLSEHGLSDPLGCL